MTEDYLFDLNEEQVQAVTETEGFVRVIAGAGSGKTRALSHRFAYLVEELGILPSHILCVTFTNKSAREMRQRIHRLTGDNDTGYINTFHGFCVSVLQEDSHAVQYPKNFIVLDNSDINDMLKIIYEERGLTLRDMTFGDARDMIEIHKLFKNPEYYLDMINMDLEVLRLKYNEAVTTEDIIFYGYLYQEKKAFALDYNDLIKFTLYIFEQNAEIRLKWQKRLEYIMIDEFQDIDGLQYHLMEVLCGYHKNLFVVGDPDQTIYTWRGADVKYLLNFERAFPGTKTIMMMKNYRSEPGILYAANDLIAHNEQRIRKDLIPTRASAMKPIYHHAMTSLKEAEWIADRIEELSNDKNIPKSDIAVLYRAHYVTRLIEECFIKRKIPYTIYSGVQFFDRIEIKDALCYLRMTAYHDDISFRRIVNVPKRNIGNRRMQYLEEYSSGHEISLYNALKENLDHELFRKTEAAAFVDLIEKFTALSDNTAVSDLFSKLMNESGYEEMLRTEGAQERLDNLAELKQSIFDFEINCGEEADLDGYLRSAALFTNQDVEETGDKVKMMTVHAAKGLEFPYVFLCGMNEGIFPSGKVKNQDGMEEERRLAFVAFTRAMNGLYLSEGLGRNFDGSPRYPSRFILELDPELLEFTSPPDENLNGAARRYIKSGRKAIKEAAIFKPGQRVRHRIFGDGTVQAIDSDLKAYLIRFDRFDTERTVAFKVEMRLL